VSWGGARLVQPVGRTRGRYYLAEPVLLAERRRIRASRAPGETGDPFELASERLGLDIS